MNEEQYDRVMNSGIIKGFSSKIQGLKINRQVYNQKQTLKGGVVKEYQQLTRSAYIPTKFDVEGEVTTLIMAKTISELIDVLVDNSIMARSIKDKMGLMEYVEFIPSDVGQTAPKPRKKLKDTRDNIDKSADKLGGIHFDPILGRVWNYDDAPDELNEYGGVISRDDLDDYGNPLQ